MPEITYSEERMIALLDNAEGRFLLAASSAITAMEASDLLSRTAIERLIEQGRIEEVGEEAGHIGAVGIFAAYAAIFTANGIDTIRHTETALNVIIGFDVSNHRAVQHLRETRFRLISDITIEQRDAIQQTLVEGTGRGLNPRQQAVNVRRAIGLTGPQELAARNYRIALERGSADALDRELRDRRFDPRVRRAVAGEPLTRQQIDRMVERYRDRQLRHRARVIARTEALRAVHAGAHEAYQQAIESGNFSADEVVRTWRTAADERVRPTHVAANGQRRGLDLPFLVGGARLLYPGDERGPARETIQCRCVVAVRVNT